MKTLLSRMFRRDSRPWRGVTRPIRRKATLGLERLDDRIAPSVTASLSNGQLLLSGDAGNDTVTVNQRTVISLFSGVQTFVDVNANFADGSNVKSWNTASATNLVFLSNGVTDSFTNYTTLDARFVGGSGQTTM